MKLSYIASILSLALLSATRAQQPQPDKPAAVTILFLGDSITAAGGFVKIIDTELTKQSPANPPKVISHGRSSETTSDLSEAYHPGRRPCVFARLDAELADSKPTWVVACYGINDGIYHPFNEKRFAAYQKGIETLIQKVQASGARIVLLTAPPYARTGAFSKDATEAVRNEIFNKANAAAEIEAEKDPNKFGYRTPYEYYDEVMARYAKWLLTLNGRKGVSVVDLRTPMLAKLKESHDSDPIHPNAVGHAIMAEAFLKQWPTIVKQAKAKP